MMPTGFYAQLATENYGAPSPPASNYRVVSSRNPAGGISINSLSTPSPAVNSLFGNAPRADPGNIRTITSGALATAAASNINDVSGQCSEWRYYPWGGFFIVAGNSRLWAPAESQLASARLIGLRQYAHGRKPPLPEALYVNGEPRSLTLNNQSATTPPPTPAAPSSGRWRSALYGRGRPRRRVSPTVASNRAICVNESTDHRRGQDRGRPPDPAR